MGDIERIELAARRAQEEIMRQPKMDIARAFQVFADELAKLRGADGQSEPEEPEYDPRTMPSKEAKKWL